MNSASAIPSRRSIADFLKPLVAEVTSSRLVRQTGLRFERDGQVHELPRFQFVGPRGGVRSSSFGASLGAALLNLAGGLLVAWVLVRYQFWGKRLVDALVDLPFALPTAVAGIALTAVYSRNGWIGGLLEPLGVKVAFTPLGVFVALTFIGLPFVVRTVQPVLEELEAEIEEAAASLGANRWQTFRRVLLPVLYPSLLTGFALAFARALGEYGSVVFISGNMPMKTMSPPSLSPTTRRKRSKLPTASPSCDRAKSNRSAPRRRSTIDLPRLSSTIFSAT